MAENDPYAHDGDSHTDDDAQPLDLKMDTLQTQEDRAQSPQNDDASQNSQSFQQL